MYSTKITQWLNRYGKSYKAFGDRDYWYNDCDMIDGIMHDLELDESHRSLVNKMVESWIADHSEDTMKKLYCVVYRTGGTENFKWNRTLAYPTFEEAWKAKEETERMGYKALLTDYALSLAIGLPETYDCYDEL